MRRFILSLLILNFLTACGQTGDLYLPEKNIPQKKLHPQGSHTHGPQIY